MKLIRTDNQIISLENVKEISLHTSGSGAKSNPYQYNINIEYMNKERSWISCKGSKEKAEDIMNKIYDILVSK